MKTYTVFYTDEDGAIVRRVMEAEAVEDAIEALCRDVFGGGCSLIGAVEGDVVMTTGSDEEGSGIISCDDYPGANEDDCDCSNRSWYGTHHDSACPLAGQPMEEV